MQIWVTDYTNTGDIWHRITDMSWFAEQGVHDFYDVRYKFHFVVDPRDDLDIDLSDEDEVYG